MNTIKRKLFQLKIRIVGWLLYHANTSPPVLRRREFYTLKTRILLGWGKLVCYDLQHIVKECWNCDEFGGKGCYRCRSYGKGGGIWDEFWVWLEKREIAGYEFHIPHERFYRAPEGAQVNIEGYVTHKVSKRRMNKEAALWLFLLFEPRTFWKSFGLSGSCGNIWTPLVCLENIAFKLRYPHCWREMWQSRIRRFKRKHKRQPRFIALNIKPERYDDGIPF